MTEFIQINRPKRSEVPILINFPHSGTQFPDELRAEFKQRYLQCPEDADWFLPQVYSFANELGITTMATPYSRYVVDLNSIIVKNEWEPVILRITTTSSKRLRRLVITRD